MKFKSNAVLLLALAGSTLHGGARAQTPNAEPVAAPASENMPASAQNAPKVPTAQPQPSGDKPASVESIEVKGKNDAVDQRRNSTAAKIIITREDIQQYGDSNIAEVMRRLPGVTQSGRPGRGGPPALRGMAGGFTQLLIDGQRIPPGFSLDQLSPEQVERIEILRAPTAETGARAIAGTINVVLREPIRKTNSELQLSVEEENGVQPMRVAYTQTGTFLEKGTWTLSANTGLGPRSDASTTVTRETSLTTGVTTLEQFGTNVADNLSKSLFVNLRGQWQLGRGENFGVMMFSGANQPQNAWVATLNQTAGDRPAQYAVRSGHFDGRFAPSRINFNLNKNWDSETRYEIRGGVGRFNGEALLRSVDTLANGTTGLVSSVDTRTRDVSWNLTSKVTRSFAQSKHSVTTGFELEHVDRDQTSVTLYNGIAQLAELGEEFDTGTRRFAIYAQDEWEIAEPWSANLGVRYETIRTRSQDQQNSVENLSRVFTPLGHLVWRFAAPAKDQLRLSVTQSYRSPSVEQISARPFLNTVFPVPGANSFASADRAGNPTLKPERANGIDLAYEHFFKSGGNFSVNLFHRQIKDLIRNVTSLENVSWATSPRYVSRPQNFSEAFSQGLELDTKFSLSEISDVTLPLSFKLNASLFRSEVKDVIGPNNRISEQPKSIANVSMDYRMRSQPVSLGTSIAWTPGYTLQTTNLSAQTVGLKRVIDAYALWTINQQTKLRFTVSNATPEDTVTDAVTITDTDRVQSITTAKNYRNVGLRLEMRF